MPSPDRMIWDKFHIKRGDLVPNRAWQGTRQTLAELFGEMGLNRGVEIGVEVGIFSKILLDANPNLHLMLVDPWSAYRNQRITSSAERGERLFQRCQKYLAGRNVEYIRKTSMDAVKDIQDASLDFIYIDGLHDFDPVMLDLIHWCPKVRNGGIISGHDFVFNYRCGVIAAVQAYTVGHAIWPWYVTNEPFPSFFWVQKDYA